MRRWRPTYTRAEVVDAVAHARSLSGALRRLGLRPVGGNHRTLHKLIDHYGISVEHLDSNWSQRGRPGPRSMSLDEILVEHSTYASAKLKRRLYDAGLKQRRWEMCGQGAEWQGRRMSLILDHVNGVADDNRIENVRIVCANCNATLDTHCGRKNAIHEIGRACLRCDGEFIPRYASQRYCSRTCGSHSSSGHDPHPERRKVPRPPYEQLMAELAATSYSAVARAHGVSDNVVRKWVRWYQADRERREAA